MKYRLGTIGRIFNSLKMTLLLRMEINTSQSSNKRVRLTITYSNKTLTEKPKARLNEIEKKPNKKTVFRQNVKVKPKNRGE